MPPGMCRQMVTVASQAHPLKSADHSNISGNGRWEGLCSGEPNRLLFPVRLAVRTVSWGWPHQGGFWKHPHVIPNFCLEFCGKRCHSIWILGCVLKPPLPEAAANYCSSNWQAYGVQIPCQQMIWLVWMLCLECSALRPSSVCHQRPWREGENLVNLEHLVRSGSCVCYFCSWRVFCSLPPATACSVPVGCNINTDQMNESGLYKYFPWDRLLSCSELIFFFPHGNIDAPQRQSRVWFYYQILTRIKFL